MLYYLDEKIVFIIIFLLIWTKKHYGLMSQNIFMKRQL